jgi:BioD-like phosphotransacetylase family protein
MPSYVILSPAPGAGKTTVAVALSQNLLKRGTRVNLQRLGDDPSASEDSALFAALAGTGGDTTIIEAQGGDASAGPDSPALIVIDAGAEPAGAAAFYQQAGGRVAGAVLNRVPSRRKDAFHAEMELAGVNVLFSIPEDRLLATPTLGRVAAALTATPMFFDGNGDRPLDRLVIAPVSADPGQGYFARTEANAVIVRSDKPDLQLAALNAGASCLIVTGGLPLLGYVLERAQADEVPIVPTQMDTLATVKAVEELYAAGPFNGSKAVLGRLTELTAGIEAMLPEASA